MRSQPWPFPIPARRRPCFAPGEHVHHVQAHHALEDREAWSLASLVQAGDGVIDVEFDGVPRRYRCRFADDLARIVDELPVARTSCRVTVMVAERWSLLGFPSVNPAGRRRLVSNSCLTLPASKTAPR